MRILITNDDGIDARGLALLETVAASLSDDIWVVAPSEEQSGTGHSLTLTQPVRLRKHGAQRFSVTGTPTDAVMMALAHIMKDVPPDLILVDAPAPGGGKVFDWSLVDFVAAGPNIILAGGLTPDNVSDAVRVANPWGVDVSSGVEKSPGKKDALKVKAFIERARAAAPQPHLGPDEMPYDWADDE